MSRRPQFLPRGDAAEGPFERHHRAVLLGDGRVLPIEERLGRRLLRTIPPESTEGRELLRAGRVTLYTESRAIRRPIGDVLDRLEREARASLADEGADADRQLALTLQRLERHRQDYGA